MTFKSRYCAQTQNKLVIAVREGSKIEVLMVKIIILGKMKFPNIKIIRIFRLLRRLPFNLELKVNVFRSSLLGGW